MAEVKATFYLPVRDNDGRDLSTEVDRVEDRLFDSFGTWTRVGLFKGAWRMKSGERKLDTSVVYTVIIDEGELPQLREILQEYKSSTTQEVILLELVHDVDVELL